MFSDKPSDWNDFPHESYISEKSGEENCAIAVLLCDSAIKHFVVRMDSIATKENACECFHFILVAATWIDRAGSSNKTINDLCEFVSAALHQIREDAGG